MLSKYTVSQIWIVNKIHIVWFQKCVRRNLGKKTVQLIEESSDWTCFRCDLKRLWEHRALCWGLSTFLREQRLMLLLYFFIT